MSLISRLAVEAARGFGFLSGSKYNVPASYLVVAGGGGGGGAYYAGGGGAGGYQTSTFTLSTLNTYSITVGAGGNGGANGVNGAQGSNSVVSGTGLTTVTSTGGGYGSCGGASNPGGNGGSGGGAGNQGGSGGTATSGQGNNGGSCVGNLAGGGGGGASSAGTNSSSSTTGANGGNGSASSISGSSVTYAGGGGGGGISGNGGSGGTGGGGNGGNQNTAPTAGTVNLGGGGGGCNGNSGSFLTGAAGGSGIVIISYASATPRFVGGTMTTSGGNQIHTFTSSGTLSPLTPITASYLVVAGGGAGGGGTSGNGGGGGAGGLLTSSTTLYSGATYVVTVGGGGATSSTTLGGNGSNSVLSGTGLTTVTSTGGGGGGSRNTTTNGQNGGSGGGASSLSSAGTGTSGQGNNGGAGVHSGNFTAGGGGGASAVGSAGNGTVAGAGGNGTASSISGSSLTYAGGGGGACNGGTANGGAGGTGGGGAGSDNASYNGVSGTTNLGGGGGGGSANYVASGAGGSGVVIISYAGSQAFNGGLVTSSGGNTIHTFTSTGALTPLTNNLNNSLRLRSSASAYLSRTPASAGNRQTWTWSAWVKRGILGSSQGLFYNSNGVVGNGHGGIYIDASDSLWFGGTDNGASYTNAINTSAVFRDPSAWYHIVVVCDTTNATSADRSRIYVNGNQQSVTTTQAVTQNANLQINRATRTDIGTLGYTGGTSYLDGYMADINFIDGQALEPYYFGNNDAYGNWKPIKYTGLYGVNGFYLTFSPTSLADNSFTYSQDFTNAAWNKTACSVTANTTTAPDGTTTASKLVDTATLNSHNLYRTFTESNVTRTLSIYAKVADVSRPYFSLSISDYVAYDCIAVFDISTGIVTYTSTANANYTSISASIKSVGNGWYRCSLTATKGSVNPNSNTQIALCDASGNTYFTGTGSLGTYIWGAQFNYSSTLKDYAVTTTAAVTNVNDVSGNNNTWSATNINYTTVGTTYDSMLDVPTNTSATVANYAVMNPLKTPVIGTYSNANLTVAFGTNDFTPAQTTIYPSSGKWYWEAVWVSGSNARIGVQNTTVASTDFGSDSAGWRWENGGVIYNNGTLITVSSYATGDVLGFCLDLDSGKLYVSKNGTWQNSAVPASGTGAVATNIPTNTLMSPAGSTGYLPTTITWNFGQRPFTYTPPSGFVALNTYNLPTPTILQGNKYMDANIYTGNSSTQTIVNQGQFKPDLVWTKSRTSADEHWLNDSVRGLNNYLNTNSTAAASTFTGGVTSLNSNGYSVNYAASNGWNGPYNYVGWQWQAGQGSTSSNTSGTITSTVSVNATAGFSIVTYTGNATSGATVGHGLGVAPRFIIAKNRSSGVTDWPTYHISTGNNGGCTLNEALAKATTAIWWNNTTPTSTLVTLGSGAQTNGSGNSQLLYCWAEIEGFSKFGSYTGNANSDGPFVYCGFRPKYVLLKNSSASFGWTIWDTSRNTYNVVNNYLVPNTTSAEASNNSLDILSNGFKIRDPNAFDNGSGNTIIFAAFAENPFNNANAR